MASVSSARSRVFAGYRRLFRARRQLFEGDVEAMQQSRVAIRQEFLKHDNIQTVNGNAHFEGLLSMVDEAVDMLTHGIVRGNLNQQTGNYGTSAMTGSLSSCLGFRLNNVPSDHSPR
jgi:hypothetical protein